MPQFWKNEGFCRPCKKSRCEICEHVVSTDSFESTLTYWIYFITPPDLKCSSENVVYPFTCKSCSKQYTGSIIVVPTENFWKEKWNPLSNMSWKLFSQMDWMSVKLVYFDIYLSSLFVIVTQNIYCNRWQWHVRLYV